MKTAYGNQHDGRHAIMLVPHWMKERLSARNEGLNNLLIFKKATQLFSVRDLAGFLALQRKMHYLTGRVPSIGTPDPKGNYELEPCTIGTAATCYPDQNRGFNSGWDLTDHWDKTIDNDNAEEVSLYSTINILSNTEELSKEIDARLFSSGTGVTERDHGAMKKCPDDGIDSVFEMINVDASLTYVIINPGSFTTAYMEKSPNRLKLLETILQSFYRTMEPRLVSRTVWFESYVKTLDES